MMVHDDLTRAADIMAALEENMALRRQMAMKCLMSLAEQCPADATIEVGPLAAFLSMMVEDG